MSPGFCRGSQSSDASGRDGSRTTTSPPSTQTYALGLTESNATKVERVGARTSNKRMDKLSQKIFKAKHDCHGKMMHRRAGLAICLSALGLLQQVAEAGSTIIFTTDRSALPGTAYQSDKEAFLPAQCVQGTMVSTGAGESSLQLDQQMSESQLSSELGFSFGARARYGVTEASLAANFVNRSMSNAFSVSAIYSAHYNFAPRKVVSNTLQLTKVGISVSRPEQFDRWTETCGDYFVDEVRKGAKFYFSIRVDFSSQAQKTEFSSQFSLSGSLGSVSTSLQQATQKYGSNVRVTVSAYQLGGDISKISGIFDASGGVTDYLSCTLGKFESCAKVIANAIQYAADTRTGFPSQLAAGQVPGPSDLAYGVSSYKAYGIYPHDFPGLAQVVQLARDSLAKTFEIAYRQRLTADRLLETQLVLTRRKEIEGVRDTINTNLNTILSVSKICYEQAVQCPTAVNTMKLDDVDTASLFPDSFSTLCAASLLNDPTDPLRETIQSLINVVDNGGHPDDAIDCRIYERLLAKVRVIDLSKNMLSDISVFASLGNLERLILDDNGIKDVAPLSYLTQLEYLSLNHNKIVDVTPLGGLVLLKTLSLDDNRIKDIKAISSLSLLEYLSIPNNQISDIQPIADLPRLTIVDLENNNIKDLAPMKERLRLECINLRNNLLSKDQIDRFMQLYKGTITVTKTGDIAKVNTRVGPYCSGPSIEEKQ